jgi:hypothetical protein
MAPARPLVLTAVLAVLARAPDTPAEERQRLHVGIDLGSEFAKVALELAAGPCESGAVAGACRGLVRRSDPIVLTPAGKVRLARRSLLLGPRASHAQPPARPCRLSLKQTLFGRRLCSARPRPLCASVTTRSCTETTRWPRRSATRPSRLSICASCSAGAAQPAGGADQGGSRRRGCRGMHPQNVLVRSSLILQSAETGTVYGAQVLVARGRGARHSADDELLPASVRRRRGAQRNPPRTPLGSRRGHAGRGAPRRAGAECCGRANSGAMFRTYGNLR